MQKIPFSKITIGDEEIRAITDVIKNGWVVLGPKTKEFEDKFAEYVGAKYAVFLESGTAALALALKASSDYYKDFVSIPSLTFVSDAEVVYNAGLKIKFVDVDDESFCVDEQHQNLLPVNLTGNLAKGKGKVIDSCHRFEKDDVKNSDSLWCYSFYATKNITTVQGGMIALNNESTYNWLIMARDHGMTKGTAQRYKGNNPIYDVKFPAYRVKGDDFRAVIGIEQLKKLPWITEERNRVKRRYNTHFGLDRTGNHLYPILVNNRDEFIKTMFEQGIQTSIHFLPIHKFAGYKQNVRLPVTDFLGEHLVSLPMYPQMKDKEVDYVAKAVLKTNLMITDFNICPNV